MKVDDKEHIALVKLAERAAIASEFLQGVNLGEGGSRIRQLLEEALDELDEVLRTIESHSYRL